MNVDRSRIDVVVTRPINTPKRKLSGGHNEEERAKKAIRLNENHIQATSNQEGIQFSSLKMKDQLDVIAQYLQHHSKALPFLKSFNETYFPQRDAMQESEACAHLNLIKDLINELSSLQEHSKQGVEEFQTQAFFLLGLLARNGTACLAINAAAGIKVVVAQLQIVCKVSLFSSCCFALGNFCSAIEEEGSFFEFIEEKRVISLLLNTLVKNMVDWELVQQIAFALGNIVYVSDFEESVLAANGVQVVLDALMTHIDSICMKDVIFFLLNVSYGEAGRKSMMEHHAIAKILYALQKHILDPEFSEFSLGILFDLTFSSAIPELVKSPNINIIYNAILQHRTVASIVPISMKLLMNLFVGAEPADRFRLVESGLVETIQAMNLPPQKTRSIFAAITKSLASFSSVPADPVPSLQETVARRIMKEKIDIQFIPDDLKSYIQTPLGNCSVCEGVFYEHCWKKLARKKVAGEMVPMYLKCCSRNCFESTNDNQ